MNRRTSAASLMASLPGREGAPGPVPRSPQADPRARSRRSRCASRTARGRCPARSRSTSLRAAVGDRGTRCCRGSPRSRARGCRSNGRSGGAGRPRSPVRRSRPAPRDRRRRPAMPAASPVPIAATAASRAATTAANTRSCSASGRGASTPTQEMSANTERSPGSRAHRSSWTTSPRASRRPRPDALVVRIGARLPRGGEHRAVAHQPGARDQSVHPLLHVRLVHGPAVGEGGPDPAPGVARPRRAARAPPSGARPPRPRRACRGSPRRGPRTTPGGGPRARAGVRCRGRGRRSRGRTRRTAPRPGPGEAAPRGPPRPARRARCSAPAGRGGARGCPARSRARYGSAPPPPGGPRPTVGCCASRAARRARGRKFRRGGSGYKKAIRRGRPPGWPERCARRPAWRCSARNPSAVPARRTAR